MVDWVVVVGATEVLDVVDVDVVDVVLEVELEVEVVDVGVKVGTMMVRDVEVGGSRVGVATNGQKLSQNNGCYSLRTVDEVVVVPSPGKRMVKKSTLLLLEVKAAVGLNLGFKCLRTTRE